MSEGPVLQKWVATVAGRYSSLTTEYVPIDVSAVIGNLITDPTAYTIQAAFIVPGTNPVGGDWRPAAWLIGITGTTKVAQSLIGPGGSITLAPGEYTVWVNIAATPEVVIRPAGTIEVF